MGPFDTASQSGRVYGEPTSGSFPVAAMRQCAVATGDMAVAYTLSDSLKSPTTSK